MGYDELPYGRWASNGKGDCGPIPEPFADPDVVPRSGETFEGTVCWSVPKEVIRGGVIFAEDTVALDIIGSVATYFAGVRGRGADRIQ